MKITWKRTVFWLLMAGVLCLGASWTWERRQASIYLRAYGLVWGETAAQVRSRLAPQLAVFGQPARRPRFECSVGRKVAVRQQDSPESR